MAIEKVYDYLNEIGFADKIMEFDESTATVELAAGNDFRCREIEYGTVRRGRIFILRGELNL